MMSPGVPGEDWEGVKELVDLIGDGKSAEKVRKKRMLWTKCSMRMRCSTVKVQFCISQITIT